jgi:alanine dehydrogenase
MCPGNVRACRQTTLHILQGLAAGSTPSGTRPTPAIVRACASWYTSIGRQDGSLRAVIEADRLGMMRTGAARRCDALAGQTRRAGGGCLRCRLAGRGAYRSACAVRPLQAGEGVCAPHRALAAFCARMSARLGIEVIAAASPEDVVRGSDIVSTVTTSATPLFNAEWLSPGTHINAAGSNSLIRRELGEDVLKRCSPIVVDSVETALREAGDLLPCWKRGACRRASCSNSGT